MITDSTVVFDTRTWNPIVMCDRNNGECSNCYTFMENNRLHKIWIDNKDDTTWPNHKPHCEVQLIEDRLREPMRWRKPSMIAVNDLSDLCDPSVPLEYVQNVLEVVAVCPRHIFQISTKRPDRLYDAIMVWQKHDIVPQNLWIGINVNDQNIMEPFVSMLLAIPAVLHWICIDPFISPIDLGKWLGGDKETESHLDWVVASESVDPYWMYALYRQCREANVTFTIKQQ